MSERTVIDQILERLTALERGKGELCCSECGCVSEPTIVRHWANCSKSFVSKPTPTPAPTVERFRVWVFHNTNELGGNPNVFQSRFHRTNIGEVVATTDTGYLWKVDIGKQVLKLNSAEYTALVSLMLKTGSWERV